MNELMLWILIGWLVLNAVLSILLGLSVLRIKERLTGPADIVRGFVTLIFILFMLCT